MEITYLWFGTVTHSISVIITKRAFTKGSGNKKTKKTKQSREHSSMICSNLYTGACCDDASQLMERQLRLKHKQTTDQGDPHSRCSPALLAQRRLLGTRFICTRSGSSRSAAKPCDTMAISRIRCGDGLFYWSSQRAIKFWLFSKATVLQFPQINSSPHRWDGPMAERSLHNSLISAAAWVYLFFNWTLNISWILYILCSLFTTQMCVREDEGWWRTVHKQD